MWHFLEHDYDPLRSLRTARRVLRPGGTLVIEVPRLDSRTFRWFGDRWPGLQAPQHTVLLDRDHLHALVHKAGLEVVDYLPYGAFPAYFYLFTGVAFRMLKGRGLNLRKAILPYFLGQLVLLPLLTMERRLNLAMQTIVCRRASVNRKSDDRHIGNRTGAVGPGSFAGSSDAGRTNDRAGVRQLRDRDGHGDRADSSWRSSRCSGRAGSTPRSRAWRAKRSCGCTASRCACSRLTLSDDADDLHLEPYVYARLVRAGRAGTAQLPLLPQRVPQEDHPARRHQLDDGDVLHGTAGSPCRADAHLSARRANPSPHRRIRVSEP